MKGNTMNSNCFFCKAVLGVFFIVALGTMCFGQSFWKRDYGPGFIFKMLPESGGNFLFTGQSGNNARLININSDGDTLSTNTYGETNSVFASVLPTQDCFLILVGQRDNKGRLIKIITSGDTVWTKSFPDSNSYFSTTMLTTSNYNFLFAGGADGKAWLVKIQSDGTILWKKTYGENPSLFASIYETTDGDYLIAGNMQNMAWLIKITYDGDTLWTRIYADSTSGFQSILPTSDDHFLLTGFSKDKAWLVKIKPDGDTVWTKTYGNGDSNFKSVLNTSDGNYIIAGQQSDQTTSKPLVMKIKPNGDTMWTKTYMDNAHTIAFLSSGDGNFILSGTTTNAQAQYCWAMSIIDNQYAYKNQPFTFAIPAANPNSSDYVYTPIKAPSDMTLSVDGTISWSPTTDSVYIEHVEYSRKNSAGQTDTLSFDIFVNSPSTSAKKLFRSNKIDLKKFDIVTASSSAAMIFFLPSNCSSVCIYDITGKIVDRIAPTISSTGSYAIFSGATSARCNMPSGKYFARVSYGKNSRVKPFLFVR